MSRAMSVEMNRVAICCIVMPIKLGENFNEIATKDNMMKEQQSSS